MFFMPTDLIEGQCGGDDLIYSSLGRTSRSSSGATRNLSHIINRRKQLNESKNRIVGVLIKVTFTAFGNTIRRVEYSIVLQSWKSQEARILIDRRSLLDFLLLLGSFTFHPFCGFQFLFFSQRSHLRLSHKEISLFRCRQDSSTIEVKQESRRARKKKQRFPLKYKWEFYFQRSQHL